MDKSRPGAGTGQWQTSVEHGPAGKPDSQDVPRRGPSIGRVKEALRLQSLAPGGHPEHSHTVWHTVVIWQPEAQDTKAFATVLGQGGATVWADDWQVTTVGSRTSIGQQLQQSRPGDNVWLGQVISVDGGPVLLSDQRRQRQPRPGRAEPAAKTAEPSNPEASGSAGARAGAEDPAPGNATAPGPQPQPRHMEDAGFAAREVISRREDLERFYSGACAALREKCEALLAALPALLGPPPAPQALRVVFIGRFETGKSWVLNALAGENLLPRHPGGCTACLTTLCHGSEHRYVIENGDRAEEVPLERFKQLADTEQRGGALAAGSAFRVEAPLPILEDLTLMDTPGYDGVWAGAPERARAAIDRAAHQADICVMVLRAIGISERDVEALRRVQPTCPELVVLLNHSDDYDTDQMTESLAASMALVRQHAKPSTPGFVVSARWQTASPERRDQIRQHREDQGYDGDPVHEWKQFTAYLGSVSGRRRDHWACERLAAGEKACSLAREIERSYDIRAQAEHAFLSHQPTLEQLLVPPLGPQILQQAVKAAREGRPLPWAVLARFGVTPQLLAPRLALSEELVPQIQEQCLELALDVGREACERYDHAGVQRLRQAVAQICGSASTDAGLEEIWRERFEWWEWCTGCADAKFDYASLFEDLRDRWTRQPEHVGLDTAAVREQLRQALGSADPAPPRRPLLSAQEIALRRRGERTAARRPS